MTTCVVTIDYTNYRGERAVRRVVPVRMMFGSNQWHRHAQWLMVAVDLAKGEERIFALCDIHSWTTG